jgi:hypothetical protein
VRSTRSRGNVPVDRADVIAGLVFADLFELNALPFEDAMVLAGKNIGNQARSLYLNTADFL